jgi:hypothetical protein
LMVKEPGVAVMPSGRLAMVTVASVLPKTITEIEAAPPGKMDADAERVWMDSTGVGGGGGGGSTGGGVTVAGGGTVASEEPPPQPIQTAHTLKVRKRKKILKDRAKKEFR